MKSFLSRRGVLRALTLFLTLGALGISSSVLADTGGLEVTITDLNGAPIAGAEVTATSPTSLINRSGTTGDNGVVFLRGLTPGQDYTITVEAAGYNDFSISSVAVITDKLLSLRYELAGEATELGAVVVTGQAFAAVDTTSATTGAVLTLDVVESLPTGRSYQSYLQLVPAVKPSSTGNPSSRSGVNYRNINGAIGLSTDNLYILDGVNVTDPVTGTFGSNINSEIIKQQTVLTGGVPAKYAGGTGLVSIVTTKSGSNEFHGSLNYYFQNDSLVAEDEHGTTNSFSSYDAAATLGGPVLKDTLWFFVSYQKKYSETEIANPATGVVTGTSVFDAEYAFFKATYQMTNRDRFQLTFFNDPVIISNASLVPQRARNGEQGGDNYILSYSRQWDNLSLKAYSYKHEASLNSVPVSFVTRNDVGYLASQNPTLEQLNRGGAGSALTNNRDRTAFGIEGSYWLDTDWGIHEIQFGVMSSKFENIQSTDITGPDNAQYESISTPNSGITLGAYIASTNWQGPRTLNPGDLDDIITAINASPAADQASFYALLDTDNNGTITTIELQAYQFTSTAGNPNGEINAYRFLAVQENASNVGATGHTFYLEDTWTIDQWTINAGLRAEEWIHYASTGEDIYTFGWDIAPRVSVVYDLFGDSTSKIWAFYGRYYDPIRANMTDFAGNVTGNISHEQIYLDNQWLTFRVRGGTQVRDATFAPTTQTPYTDELLLGYATTLAPNLSLEAVFDYRITTDILEDIDEGLYTSLPTDSRFYISPADFGYPNGFPTGFNFFIGTMPGAERRYAGVTISLTKYRSDNWMGKLSYTFNHFEGNSNSDSNADFQGDLLFFDPRAPGRWGEMVGNIDHMFQAYGAYYFDFGLELGGVFNWNSGYAYTRSIEAASRHLPAIGPAYEFDGVTRNWIPWDTVGAYDAPAYWTLDLRVKYNMDLGVGQTEFFLDIFNALNRQVPSGEEDLSAGTALYAFGEANAWTSPRRMYLGVRYSF